MAGGAFVLGEEKVRPGTYVRVTGLPGATAILVRGVVAALFRSSWGPTGEAVLLESPRSVEQTFGEGGTTAVLKEAFRRARRVVAIRQGTGGAKAHLDLSDGAGVPVNVVDLDTKYVGIRGNDFKVTKRTSLLDATKKEFLLYEGTTFLESFTYTPGADEPAALAAAVNEKSQFLDAIKVAVGDGTVDDVSQVAMAAGVDPTVNGAAVTAALDISEVQPWNVLTIDSVDPSVHSTVEAFIDRVRDEGKRVMAVVAEPTSVAKATRQTNAKAVNNKGVVYVGHSFKTGDTVVGGVDAAARVAGMVAAAELTESLTNSIVDGATDVGENLSNADYEAMILAGVLTFSKNPTGQIVIEYGITSLSTPGNNEDEGWKKIRRVRTRDELMMQMVADAEPLRGKVNNDEAGRALVQARYQGTINRFINRGALLPGGRVFLDPANQPAGDSAWFIVDVDDLDSIEKIYDTFEFRFAPPTAVA